MKSFLTFALLASCALAQLPYQEKPTYARSRDFDLQHIKLELSFDLPARKLIGTATLRVAPLAGDIRELALDSAELNIESVTVGGQKAAFRTGEEKLYVTLDRQFAAGTPVEVVVHYSTQPKRGLSFVMPDQFHPNRPKQIWANGDTAGGNNRYWFPGYDFPNDKTTTEMIATVPAGWEVVSNGKLVGTNDNKSAGTTTFHWLQDKPMSTYLVSLVAGEFDKGQDNWKVPVPYYVPRGRGKDIPRTFGRTTQMLQFFSENIGPYPWAKYAQAMVDTFGGGMENTSATTEGAGLILDERNFEDRKAGTDSVIAHEMAHQWFGDLVTCADWRHTWLNEGFATYFEALWEEHASGRDVFDWNELRAGRGIASFASPYSVVPREGQEGGGAYSLIYNKGGWTLHMVRGQLGDARFWKAIQYYTKKFSYQTATTSDFVEAISESTGQDLEWLFDEYVYKPGFPTFEAQWDYDGKTQMLHFVLKQTQKVDNKPALFHVPVEIEALGDSSVDTFHLNANAESQEFYFPIKERPRTVLFDPRDIILKSITFRKPAAEWAWQLAHASRALNREEAAFALGTLPGADSVAALTAAGTGDKFYGVRVEAAQALARLKPEPARPEILKMIHDPSFEVRSLAVAALGSLEKKPEAVQLLLETARTDPSYAVRRTALTTSGRLKPANGVETIAAFLKTDSPDANMRGAVIGALQSLGDEDAVPVLLTLSRDEDDNVRGAALRSFATLGKGKKEVTDRLLQALNEQAERGDRQSAIFALQQRREPATIEALDRTATSDPVPGIARAAAAAVTSMRAPAAGSNSSSDDLNALRNRLTQIETRLDRLEKK